MKKVIYINLASVVIPIEEPAYTILNNYIHQLKSFFEKEEDGDEIIQDMEARIAELFQEILQKRNSCITENDVQKIISIIGTPEAIHSNLHDSSTDFNTQQQADNEQSSKIKNEGIHQHKKLYANQNDKIIGGVCGGIAQYFNIDASIVRILFAIFTIAWGAGIIIYILMWVLLPKQDDQPLPSIKKRLYRDVEHGKLLGVCAGIANYLQISPLSIRLIALLPIILSILSTSFFFDWMGFFLSAGLIPTTIVLYLILGAIMPSAESVKQKLEMHGTPINLGNIQAAYKDGVNSVQNFVKNQPINKNSITTILQFLLKTIAVIFIGVLLFIVLTIALIVILSLVGLVEPAHNFLYYIRLFFEQENNYYIVVVAICCILFLPIIGITNSLFKIIRGKKYFSKPIRIISNILFLISIITLILIYQKELSGLQYKKSEPIVTAPINKIDTIGIKVASTGILHDDDKDWLYKINHTYIEESDQQLQLYIPAFIDIKESEDNEIHISASYLELGKRNHTVTVPSIVQPSVNNNQIILPDFNKITTSKPYLGQQINYEIYLPKGTIYYFIDTDYSNFSKYSFGFKKAAIFVKKHKIYGVKNNQYYSI